MYHHLQVSDEVQMQSPEVWIQGFGFQMLRLVCNCPIQEMKGLYEYYKRFQLEQ